ncbi:hypothetical protein [Salinisphaera sp. Q1T1-3]|uniref:hypothetical protein n=1 Tax=Salinisphaera sp. Q1T1-3 TaxID=2321229 RepID=UPI000E76B245|nr:hypothetical protein [Salinisphaera sp. Q1T1-3]RJS93069.1 hypothetical protein D3260_09220 [Salinisphaera sp. Q1T1-3]
MLRQSAVVLSVVLAASGLAFAQSGDDPASSGKKAPPEPGHHHPHPPMPGPSLQGKGFVLDMGHGHRLQVQCGDEPMKGCLDAVRPLIARLGPPPAGAKPGQRQPKPQQGQGQRQGQNPEQSSSQSSGAADSGSDGDNT